MQFAEVWTTTASDICELNGGWMRFDTVDNIRAVPSFSVLTVRKTPETGVVTDVANRCVSTSYNNCWSCSSALQSTKNPTFDHCASWLAAVFSSVAAMQNSAQRTSHYIQPRHRSEAQITDGRKVTNNPTALYVVTAWTTSVPELQILWLGIEDTEQVLQRHRLRWRTCFESITRRRVGENVLLWRLSEPDKSNKVREHLERRRGHRYEWFVHKTEWCCGW